ncbi:MAG: hypothetical protein INF52_08335 [Rhodobacter sp.]|nr:hypothetical protein [Rhodobacter sp.]
MDDKVAPPPVDMPGMQLPGHAMHMPGHESMKQMVMERDLMLRPRIENHPHQHAMTLVGHKTVFAVHMTQFYMEEHKYQLIFEVRFPPEIAASLDTHRRRHPKDWFVLSNDETDLFTIPQIASGRKASYKAKIFQGLPDFDHKAEENPHFYPWSPDRVLPLLADFTVEVGRIVTYRPFVHHNSLQDCASYLLWGRGEEAHMTNLQNGHLNSDRFEALSFGPDFDHVLSLRGKPEGLDDAQLEAGIAVSVPKVRLRKKSNSEQCIPATKPFQPGEQVQLLYRGIQPALTVIAGESFLYGTAVCNSSDALPPEQICLLVSPTPDSMQLKKRK